MTLSRAEGVSYRSHHRLQCLHPLAHHNCSALFWVMGRFSGPLRAMPCSWGWTGLAFHCIIVGRKVERKEKVQRSQHRRKINHFRSYHPVRIPSAWRDHHPRGRRSWLTAVAIPGAIVCIMVGSSCLLSSISGRAGGGFR